MNWYNQVFNKSDDLQKSGHLFFDPYSSNMEKWYKEIGQVLSVSDFEGSHQAIAESMATGSIPAIRNWESLLNLSEKILTLKHLKVNPSSVVTFPRDSLMNISYAIN